MCLFDVQHFFSEGDGSSAASINSVHGRRDGSFVRERASHGHWQQACMADRQADRGREEELVVHFHLMEEQQ